MFEHAPLPDGYTALQPFWTKQQHECFLKSLPERRFLLWMEPRCGKSKPIVDKTCYYFERKSHRLHVNGMLVIAFPNGVHRGWVTDAFPENVPHRIRWQGFIWRSDKAKLKSYQREFDEFCKFKGLALFAVNAEALTSLECRKALGKFLKSRQKVHVVFDESSAICNSDSLRARIMANLGTGEASRYTVMMSDLDGTPVGKRGPFDYWSQVGWMGHDILGYDNETEFQHHFAEIKLQGRAPFWGKVKDIRLQLEREGVVGSHLEPKAKAALIKEVAERQAKRGVIEEDGKRRPVKAGRDWWTKVVEDSETGLPRYRNMDEIWGKLDPISYRCTFKECFPNAKQHVYQKRYFQLSDKQRIAYDQLRKEYRFELDGEDIKAEHPLTRQLRAQQITSNYYPATESIQLHEPCGGLGCSDCNDTGTIELEIPQRVIDPDNHPRLDALAIELRLGMPTVVWTRFSPDVDAIVELSKQLGIRVCRYDGKVGNDEKADSKDGFQSGKYDLIVGNQVSLSRGLPLFRGLLMVAYNNLFSYFIRKQIEARTEHGSKTVATSVVDLVAEDTVDDLSIIPALRQGMDVSTWVLKDAQREWI